MIAQLVAAIAILTGPSGLTNDPTPTFTFSGGAPLECRVDAQAWAPCEDRFTAGELSDGGHVFRVRSGSDSAFRSFTVDTVEPQVAIDGAGDLHVADTAATLTFSSEDGAELTCAIDSGEPAPCTSPFTTPDLANGTHALNVFATDGAGNQGVASRVLIVDAGPPETTLDGPEGSIKDRRPVYALASSRPRSHFQCKVDETGTWADCDAAYQTPELAPGKHTVYARAIDAAGNVDTTPAVREVEIRDCLEKLELGVVEAVAECFYKEGDYTVADSSVKINGLTFNGLGGIKLLFDVPHKRLLLRKGQLKIGSTVLYQGELKWTVPDGDRVTLANIDLSTFSFSGSKPEDSEAALDLKGDDDANVKGFDLEGSAKLELAKGGKAILTGTVGLPSVFTDAEGNGLTGSITIESDNANGVHLGGMQIKAPLVFVGKVEIHNLWVRFNGEKNNDAESSCNQESPGLRWEGGADKVVLPTRDKLTIDNVGAGFADGGFNYAKGVLNGGDPGLSIGAGIRVQRIAVSVCAGPPVTVEGRIALTAMPTDKGPRLKVPDAGILFKGGNPWSLRAEAPEATFALDRSLTFKDVYVQYASSGSIDFGARLKYSLGVKGSTPVGSLDAALDIDAGVKGWIEGGDFNADIDATGCFAGKLSVADTIPYSFSGFCPRITGVVSSTGIALCGGLKVNNKEVGSVGAGYTWGGSLKFMAGTCDLKDWRVERTSTASAAGGARAVHLDVGERGVLVAVRGVGGAPQVELRGPGGAVVRTPADGNEALRTNRAIAFENAGTDTTYVVLAHPRGGDWKVSAVDSHAIAEVKTAGMRPAPKVSATLRHGTLSYRVARQAGQRVTFEERGRGVSRTIATATRSGSVRFRPAPGAGGTRAIVALVEQDGLPRKRITVARFRAPAWAKPGAPRAVKIRVPALRKARAAASAKPRVTTITWRPAKGAARYGVRISLADGRRLFFLRAANDRVVRIPDAGRVTAVRVVGLRADNTAGPAATTSGGNR